MILAFFAGTGLPQGRVDVRLNQIKGNRADQGPERPCRLNRVTLFRSTVLYERFLQDTGMHMNKGHCPTVQCRGEAGVKVSKG